MSEASAPVSEIWKRHNSLTSDPQHFAQYLEGIAHLLQSLTENYEVEGLIGVVGQPRLDIALISRNTARDCSLDFFRINLDSLRLDAFLLQQPTEQFAVAATQVEDGRAGRDHLGYQGEVRSRRDLRVD